MVWVTLSLEEHLDVKSNSNSNKTEEDEHLLQLMAEVHVDSDDTVKIFNQTKTKISLVNTALKT